MSGRIFLLSGDDRLVPMDEEPYESEALLQKLLADYPSLLAGDQMNSEAPREWLLIQRETGIPHEEGAGSRWSVDHLFLDQDGVPTLVEVKRSSDTRIRREVVGQMLDYAANAVVNLPIERIRADFESRAEADGLDPDQCVRELLDDPDDVEQFWSRVKTNLQAGRVRLVFVADSIPSELKRVVEFLNEQMDPAEVLAVEVQQFVGDGRRTLVPRVLGQTAQAEQKKLAGRDARQWDEASFMAELEQKEGRSAPRVADQLLRWAENHGLSVKWGKGATSGSFYPELKVGGITYQTFSVWTSGTVEIQFQHMMSRAPFEEEERRREFQRRLDAIPGVVIPEDAISRRPNVPYRTLVDAGTLKRFLEVFEWFLDVARGAVSE